LSMTKMMITCCCEAVESKGRYVSFKM